MMIDFPFILCSSSVRKLKGLLLFGIASSLMFRPKYPLIPKIVLSCMLRFQLLTLRLLTFPRAQQVFSPAASSSKRPLRISQIIESRLQIIPSVTVYFWEQMQKGPMWQRCACANDSSRLFLHTNRCGEVWTAVKRDEHDGSACGGKRGIFPMI